MNLVPDLLGLLTALLVGTGLLFLVPVWLLWTSLRRYRLGRLLRSRGWPRVFLTPDLLVYPDSVFRKLPPYEEVLVTPLESDIPDRQLRIALHLLTPPGGQWVRL